MVYSALQAAMRRHRITQRELADAIGFEHPSQIYSLVQQGRVPEGRERNEVIEKIKTYFKERNLEIGEIADIRRMVTKQRFYLKKILIDNSIPFAALYEQLPGFGKADISTIVNGCRFPQKAEMAITKKIIEETLRGWGVPEEEVKKCWLPWHENLMNFTVGKIEVKKQVEYKILNRGVAMLHEAVLKQIGLGKDPFRNELEGVEDIFHSTPHDEIFQKMMDAARNQKFLAVWGAVGAGKSVLKTLLYEMLKSDSRYRIAEVMLGQKESALVSHIHEAIISDLGGMQAPNNKERQSRRVQAVLETLYRMGVKPVLLIDESHGLPSLTLKCLKRIWEHQIGFRRLIGIIILGQEELEVQLRRDIRLREVAARIELIELRPIRNFTTLYLRHKIERAGGKVEQIFDQNGLTEINRKMPAATPLEINVLASHSIKLAYDRGTLPVNDEAVRHAYAMLDGK